MSRRRPQENDFAKRPLRYSRRGPETSPGCSYPSEHLVWSPTMSHSLCRFAPSKGQQRDLGSIFSLAWGGRGRNGRVERWLCCSMVSGFSAMPVCGIEIWLGTDAPEQISSMAMEGNDIWVASGHLLIKYLRGKEVGCYSRLSLSVR
jgi:hypothetical protein